MVVFVIIHNILNILKGLCTMKFVQILMLILSTLFILPYNALSASYGTISFENDGSFGIQVPGKPKVTGSLFLWHGDWKYATPSNVETDGAESWKGAMPGSDVATGYVSYSQSVKSTPDGGADIALDFRKVGEISLSRGIFMLLQFPRDYSGEAIAFTHGSPYLAADDYKTSARGFGINLSESVSLELSVDRACIFEHRGKEGEALMNIRLSPEADARVNISLRFKPAINVSVPCQMETVQSPLAIREVKLSHEKVPKFDVIELTADITGTYDNFLDPDDITVDAVFTSPSGRKVEMPGFIYQGFKSEQEGDLELLSCNETPTWKIRFAPTETGNYTAIVNAKDRSTRAKSKEYKFECMESVSGGFVKISKPATTGSPLYFQLDNGEPLFLIGHNMPTYYPNAEEYFAKMEQGGENYNRFWMYSSALGLEWGQPVGYYRLEEAWKLDRAIEAASRHGIYLMICFDTHQDFRENWERNPYNIRQGGPCKTPLSFFTDINARELYKKRLRYIAARWSAYTNILAWEFMNEIEGWDGAEKNRPAVAKWHSEMAKVLRKNDPYEHPISSSLWTTDGWQELWKLTEMDFVQSHYYANSQRDMAEEVARICAQKRRDYPDKLHLFAEYGIMSGSGTLENDPTGVHIHNGNWAGLMSGSASVPASWWHESYIDPQNLYKIYLGLVRFVSDEKDLAGSAWKIPLSAGVSYANQPEQLSYADARFAGSGERWKKPEETIFTVNPDGTVENIGKLPMLLHGNAHKALSVPFTFRVDFPVSGRFVMHIGRAGSNGLLKIKLDGTDLASIDLPTGEGLGVSSEYVGQWKRWETVYDKDVSIDIPAGKHEIQIQNQGADWVSVDYFQLTNYITGSRPSIRVMGMQTSNTAILWLQNKNHTWYNVRDKVEINPISAVRLELSDFDEGEYKTEFWDTINGDIMESKTFQSSNGRLVIDIPELKFDVALKVKKLR